MASSEQIRLETRQRKEAMVTVFEWPQVDPWYETVLLRLPDYEIRMSSVDAQRLGHALNSAGHGTLPPTPADASAEAKIRALLDAIGPLREEDLTPESKLLAAYEDARLWLRTQQRHA